MTPQATRNDFKNSAHYCNKSLSYVIRPSLSIQQGISTFGLTAFCLCATRRKGKRKGTSPTEINFDSDTEPEFAMEDTKTKT